MIQKRSDIKWTYEEMVRKLPDESRFELRNYELIEMASPYSAHQILFKFLFKLLDQYCTQNNQGTVLFAPLDVVFYSGNVVQPDLIYISKDQNHIIKEKNITGAPDLLIEIVSKSSINRDFVEKKNDYEEFGVKEYWIVEPSYQNIFIYTLVDGKYQLLTTVDGEENHEIKSMVLPDLKLTWKEVFIKN